jgi:hypothetical protein
VYGPKRFRSAPRGKQGNVFLPLMNAKNQVKFFYLSIRNSRKMEGTMEREEIVVLESSEDEPIGPLSICCHLIYTPFNR